MPKLKFQTPINIAGSIVPRHHRSGLWSQGADMPQLVSTASPRARTMEPAIFDISQYLYYTLNLCYNQAMINKESRQFNVCLNDLACRR